MTAMYTIFGRQVPAYQLSIATFATLGLGITYAKLRAPAKELKPVINAESSEEENFILTYLKEQEANSAK